MNPTFKAIVDGQEMIVDSNLTDFTILDYTKGEKKSSMIDYIAIKDSDLFIQFSKGNCVLYSNVPIDVMRTAMVAPSIGKFYHAFIKDKFEFINVGHGNKCITPVPQIKQGADHPEDLDDQAFADALDERDFFEDEDDEY